MVRLEDLEYTRPDIKKTLTDFKILLEDFMVSNSFKETNNLFIRLNLLQSQFITAEKKCRNLNNIDNSEEFNFFDEMTPIYKDMENIYYKALLKSKFKDELKATWGEQIFTIAEKELEIFSRDIVADLVEENKLMTKYKFTIESKLKLIPSESIIIGNITDNDKRKEYYTKYQRAYLDLEDDLKDIFLSLVEVRTRMAKKLGFDNYIEMGNLRRKRYTYTSSQMENFRETITQTLLPVSKHIRQLQIQNLGLKDIYFHNERRNFVDGDLNPQVSPKNILNMLEAVLSQISPETKDYIDFMTSNNLINISNGYTKEYIMYLEDYKLPYMKANYNGYCEDIEKIFNMTGGSFQHYISGHYNIPQYNEMLPDIRYSIETSMEYIGYSGMNLIFGEDFNKYVYWHLTKNLFLSLYRALVDEFEYIIYTNYDMTYDEMKLLWKKLETKYLPYRKYEDEYLGTFWLDNKDLFINPLMSISKLIGYNMATKFLNDMVVDRKTTMKKYNEICKISGSKSLTDIIKLLDIKDPIVNLCDTDKMINHLNIVFEKL